MDIFSKVFILIILIILIIFCWIDVFKNIYGKELSSWALICINFFSSSITTLSPPNIDLKSFFSILMLTYGFCEVLYPLKMSHPNCNDPQLCSNAKCHFCSKHHFPFLFVSNLFKCQVMMQHCKPKLNA